MKLPFWKMHGCGNDFVVVDGRKQSGVDWSKAAPRLLDRRFGVGADQLLVIERAQGADARMNIFEQTGLASEMCGNGIRCVAWFLSEELGRRGEIRIDTPAGLKVVHVESRERIRVDMGPPDFRSDLWGTPTRIEETTFDLYALSMGNPHAVAFVKDEENLAWVTTLGPLLEDHPLFERKTNVEFVFVEGPGSIRVRVWERGAGETMACGTGACASAVASIKLGKVQSPVTVHFRGGDLQIEWKEGSTVWMTGPAALVYQGSFEWPLE